MKWVSVAILLLLWDRIEFLYYAFEGMDIKVGFILKGDPIRIDSYVYFATIYMQQIFVAIIIKLLMPIKESKYLLLACVFCFLEYFFTYGQPIATIPLPGNLYIPISCSTIRFLSVVYLMHGCVTKAFNSNG